MTNQTPSRNINTSGARSAMKAAWRLARRGQTLYGGKLRSYLAEALRIAWRELKADPVFQECQKIIAEALARKAAGTWRAPSTTMSSTTYRGCAWVGQ